MRNRLAVALAFLLLIAVPAAAQNGGGTGVGFPMPVPGAVTGFVTTVSGSLVTVLNGNVTIDAAGAVFTRRKGDEATIADVKPGLQIVVMIRNPQAAAGTMLQASNVMILDVPAGSLNGPVQSVDVAGNTLTIFGARVSVTAETRIYSFRGGRASKLSDIKPGDVAIIEVNVNGSALVAESIQAVPPIPTAALEGTVKSIGATEWVITTRNGDVTVKVTAETKIDPAVKAGDKVYVIGNADAAGNITAVAIYGTRVVPPPSDLSLEGKVKSIGTASWVITREDGTDVTVAVNANTKIEPGLKEGDAVLVLLTKDDAGNHVAAAIMKAPTKRRSAHS